MPHNSKVPNFWLQNCYRKCYF